MKKLVMVLMAFGVIAVPAMATEKFEARESIVDMLDVKVRHLHMQEQFEERDDIIGVIEKVNYLYNISYDFISDAELLVESELTGETTVSTPEVVVGKRDVYEYILHKNVCEWFQKTMKYLEGAQLLLTLEDLEEAFVRLEVEYIYGEDEYTLDTHLEILKDYDFYH